MDRIVNTWMQLVAAVKAGIIPKKHALCIDRGDYSVMVWSPFFLTDPSKNNAWYNHGKKGFHGDYKTAVEEAKAWVRKTYGYDGEWRGNATRDQIPAVVQKKFPIKRRLKEKK